MDLRLLQLADSAFPAGSFAHSQGLEALRQTGLLRGEEELALRLTELTWHTARSMLPFLDGAHRGDAAVADQACDVFLVNHVANRASRAQGRAFALAAEATFGVQLEQAPGHLAIVMGATLACTGITLDDTRRLFLFGAVRGGLSAAVRLGVVGPLRAQAVLLSLHPVLEAALGETQGLRLDDARSTAPLLELCQAKHDTLYSRLFQS